MTADNHAEPTWANQLWHARRLTDAELKQHSSVSWYNHHICNDCFTCAALHVLANERHDIVAQARIRVAHEKGWK